VTAAVAETEVTGRDVEIASVDEFLTASVSGPSAFLLLGEAGIGKTTIVRAAVEHASLAGLRVFFSRPAAGETALPYSGLADLLSSVGSDALGTLAEPQRVVLERALGRSSAPTIVEPQAVARGVLELLRREGSVPDLLLVIDDLQWLDGPTAAALTFALRRLGTVPLRVLLAARADPDAEDETPLGLAEWGRLQRLPLRALAPTELGVLLRERLGLQLPRPRLEKVWRQSGGNPLFALELGRRPEGSASVTLPSALRQRMSSFDVPVRSALSVAAAALRPTSELLQHAGVDRSALQAAVATAVLTVDGDRLVFSHPLLRAAAYELLLPEERREVHLQLAGASRDRVECGYHIVRSAVAPDESAAHDLEQAADVAASLGDHAGAAEFLLRAAELWPDPQGKNSRACRLAAAQALERAGDAVAAVELGRALIEALPPGVLRARARLLVVMCAVGDTLSIDEALAELELGMEEASGDAAVLAELHMEAGECGLSLCRLDDAEAHLRAAIRLAKAAGASTTEVSALASLGFLDCMLGRGVTDAALEAFARAEPLFLVHHSSYSPQMVLACAFLYTQEFERAEELFEQERNAAAQTGVEPIEAIARGLLAESQIRAGRWADGFRNARAALEHARQTSVGQVVTGASYGLAMIEALSGLHEEAREIAEVGLRNSEAAGDFWFRLYHRGVLGFVALTEDDAGAAVEVLEPAWRLMLEAGLGELSIFPVAHLLGEAYVAVGRVDEARAIADALRACPAGGRPWCRAMAARIEALAATADGDYDAARKLILEALGAHAELPEPFEHARTLHLSGRIERTARNWGKARAAFSDALERFDRLGAARWAEKAAADLTRLPGRRPADDELTARELEIGKLVASGLTNKEVAARLFVSVRTVEATLSRLYRKLGVRSRTELAARLP
jgi:DNA-binding CsgD family transcriptional regulator